MPETFAASSAVPLAVVERSGFIESRHVGSAIVLSPDGGASTTFAPASKLSRWSADARAIGETLPWVHGAIGETQPWVRRQPLPPRRAGPKGQRLATK
mgnify:CR=1 FL=1